MIRAVLFDLDGTLVHDDPNGLLTTLVSGAPETVAALREHDVKIGIATNQPRLSSGPAALERFARRQELIEAQIGPLDGWFVCTHAQNARCDCRKPQPGLIFEACEAFDVRAQNIAMVGDIGSDVEAAAAAGAFGILVPTAVTRIAEIERAPVVCSALTQIVPMLFSGAAA